MRWVKESALILFAVLFFSEYALADGLMLAQKREAALGELRHAFITEPEQKAIIFYSNRLEKLIISPKYEGTVESFAWVIPVLAPPRVEIGEPRIFDELAELVIDWPKSGGLQTGPRTSEQDVTVLQRKIVGDYDVSVLSSKDSQALMKWLDENGYHLPTEAIGPIQEYVKERWTFVACKVHDPSPATAEGLRSGTLAPLKLTFRALKPVYPLRLSSVNPEPFDLLIYIIMPAPSWRGMHIVNAIQQPPGAYVPYSPWKGGPLTFLEEDRRESFPTLAKFAPGTLEVYEAAANLGDNKVNPRECKADIVWDISWPPPEQPSKPIFH